MEEGNWLTQKCKKRELFSKRDFYQFHICDYLGNTKSRTYLFRLKD